MGELAARTIFSNETGPLAGVGLDTLAKNQAAILELEGAQAPQSKTISSGSISPTAAYVIVDTEGSAAADDLDVINPVLSASENLHDGMIVYLRAADSGRVVTVKNTSSANGINTYDGNDYVLSTTHWLKLQLRSGKWYEVEGRAMETALAAASAAAAASTPATTTSRGIARVATLADMAPGAVVENGPAFLAAGVHASVASAADKVPVAGSDGVIDDAWVRQPSIRGSFSNLKITTTGTNANVTCTAYEVIVKNSSNRYLTLRGVSVSASVSSSCAGGLDTGSVAASTWYYAHIIHNPTTSTTALLLSLSATAPTLPSGYTYWARVSAIRTDSTNKYPLSFKQQGRKAQYVTAPGSNVSSLPMMASGTGIGSVTTPTWVAVAWGAFSPPTASRIQVIATNQTNNQLSVVPNNNFGAVGSSNPPPAIFYGNGLFEFCLEGSNIYWANQGATSYMTCLGWEDNL